MTLPNKVAILKQGTETGSYACFTQIQFLKSL